MKSHPIEFTRDDLVVRITRYPAGEPGKLPSVEIEVESSGLPRFSGRVAGDPNDQVVAGELDRMAFHRAPPFSVKREVMSATPR